MLIYRVVLLFFFILLLVCLFFFFFFFSSRRRHTRYIGDWSSDVCSSDLAGDREVRCTACCRSISRRAGRCGRPRTSRSPARSMVAVWLCRISRSPRRSEERRVGKECRALCVPEHGNKEAIGRQEDTEHRT